ncbi:MAG: response regulator transcription factor [Chloroflexota bacterium]|mgnify:CR=1 FL=1
MPNLLIIGQESKTLALLKAGLEQSGFACSIAPLDQQVSRLLSRHSPDLLLVEVDTSDTKRWALIPRLKRESSLPVIALVAGEIPEDANSYLEVDDFLPRPYDARELTVRIQRLLNKSKRAGGELIKSENMVIDLTNCDVTVGGKAVELTFKEYELLKLLAANKGRVYTRQDLLNKIWGYDYFGGDRTVDVHVRRLRSKIEGPTDTFIETVRNIGYRFKKDS